MPALIFASSSSNAAPGSAQLMPNRRSGNFVRQSIQRTHVSGDDHSAHGASAPRRSASRNQMIGGHKGLWRLRAGGGRFNSLWGSSSSTNAGKHGFGPAVAST